MNTKQVATLNARKYIAVNHAMISWRTVLLIGILSMGMSCSKSDDEEIIMNGSPIINHFPVPNNPPIDTGTQIVYIDIDPDFTSQFVHDVYNLDLNNDGIIDFSFGTGIDPYLGILWAQPNSNTNNSNGLVAKAGPFESFVQPLDKDFIITEELVLPYYYDPFGGYMGWLRTMDKYVALRFLINEKVHYGWVRLDVISNYLWVIKDYAFNAAPNKPIYAGQKE